MQNTFGNMLRKIRKEKGFSQKELSQKCGVSVNSLSRYENGDRSPFLSVVKKIAEAMDVDINYLMNGQTLDERNQAMKNYVKERQEESKFIKNLIANAKVPEQLNSDYEALQRLMNKAGYHFEKIDGRYYFTGNNGGWQISENELEFFLNKSVDAIEMLCLKFEKEHLSLSTK